MKNKTLKKILCIVISMITAFAMPLGAFAVELDGVPLIYVGDMSDNPLYFNPNKNGSSVAFDINSSDFTGNITSILGGIVFGDSTTGVTPVINGIKGMMDDILCAPTGVSVASNVGVWKYMDPISEYKADPVYSENIKSIANASVGYISEDEIFFFSYDWRLDPLDSADSLREFINHVENVTGSNKVSLLGVGYGGVVINSYLYANEEHANANIASTVFYNCSILGNAIIGDFMKGRIARILADEESLSGIVGTVDGSHRGEAFLTFIKDDSLGLIKRITENTIGLGPIQTLAVKLIVLLATSIAESEDAHKDFGKSYNNFTLNVDNIVYDDFLKEYLRNMPGLWALVPEKDFDEAMDFLFEDEIISNTLESKVMKYRDVLSDTASTLKKAQANGINVCIVAGYGLQILPVTISLDDMSDSIESVKYASAGAVTPDNSNETGHYNNCINEHHNHISPDKDIDSSYCILPENTWFIKGVAHGDMTSESVASFVSWLIFGFDQRFVRENSDYTQYMSYSEYTMKLSPYTTPGVDEPSVQYGDVDYSGSVDAADARLALRIVVGLDSATKETKTIADVDGDGSVSADDARLILRYAVGLVHSF